MKAVSRPAVYIGFSYFGTLVLAVFLGESVTPFAAAALLILCASFFGSTARTRRGCSCSSQQPPQ